MRLRDHLRVPYLLEAQRVETAPEHFVCRLSYPELAGCTVDAATLETALLQVEALRIQIIVEMLDRGVVPPIPRRPLEASDPVWIAEQAGLSEQIIDHIRSDETRPDNPREPSPARQHP